MFLCVVLSCRRLMSNIVRGLRLNADKRNIRYQCAFYVSEGLGWVLIQLVLSINMFIMCPHIDLFVKSQTGCFTIGLRMLCFTLIGCRDLFNKCGVSRIALTSVFTWSVVILKYAFLGSFAKLRKVTVSFVMSVCPSEWNNSALPLDVFLLNFILQYFSKMCPENSSFIKIWQA